MLSKVSVLFLGILFIYLNFVKFGVATLDMLSTGFEVNEMISLLDKFCEERTIVDEIEQEIESGR